MQTKRIGIRLSEKLYKRIQKYLKIAQRKNDRYTITDLVVAAIDYFLKGK